MDDYIETTKVDFLVGVDGGRSVHNPTSDQLIEELQAADTIVIGAPMYNFAISSSLKAWIDQMRLGKTMKRAWREGRFSGTLFASHFRIHRSH